MMDMRNKMNGGDFQLEYISGNDTIFGFLEFTINNNDICSAPTAQPVVEPFTLPVVTEEEACSVVEASEVNGIPSEPKHRFK